MISLIDNVQQGNRFVLELEFSKMSEFSLLPNATRPFNAVNFGTAYNFGIPLPGSTAVCEENGKNFVYNNEGIWTEGAAPQDYLKDAEVEGSTLTITKSNGTEISFTGGGSLPSATAGQSLVHNGTEWSKQSGYGYETPGASQTITWDGDTTGKESMEIFTSNLYRVANLPQGALPNSAVITFNSTAYNASLVEGTNARCYINMDEGIFVILCDGGAFSITIAEGVMLSGTASSGVYFQKTGDTAFTSSLADTAPATVHQFDAKYIPTDAALAYAKNTGGIGYVTPATGGTITWDGDTTGKTPFTIFGAYNMYKVSDTFATAAELNNCTVTTSNPTTYSENTPITLSDLITAIEGTIVSGDGTRVVIVMGDGMVVIASPDAQTVVISYDVEGTLITETLTLERGIYFSKISGVYVNSLTYGTAAVMHTIAPSYIPAVACTNIANGLKFTVCTQAQYDALENPDESTLFILVRTL